MASRTRRTIRRPRPPRAPLRVHGDIRGEAPDGDERAPRAERRSAWADVYAVVRRIPRGRVMTYGQIATLLEARLSPRAVGWAMHGSPKGVPWQRVVNASGGCSTDRLPDMAPGMQRILLEAEGVRFRQNGTLDLTKYRWQPPAARLAGAKPSPQTGSKRRRRRA